MLLGIVGSVGRPSMIPEGSGQHVFTYWAMLQFCWGPLVKGRVEIFRETRAGSLCFLSIFHIAFSLPPSRQFLHRAFQPIWVWQFHVKGSADRRHRCHWSKHGVEALLLHLFDSLWVCVCFFQEEKLIFWVSFFWWNRRLMLSVSSGFWWRKKYKSIGEKEQDPLRVPVRQFREKGREIGITHGMGAVVFGVVFIHCVHPFLVSELWLFFSEFFNGGCVEILVVEGVANQSKVRYLFFLSAHCFPGYLNRR